MAGNGLYGFDYGGRNVPLLLPEEFAQQQGLNPFNPIAPPTIPGGPDMRLAGGVPGPILDPTMLDASSRASRDAAMKEANRAEIDAAEPLEAPGPMIRPLPGGTGPGDTGALGQNIAVKKVAEAVAKGSEPVKGRDPLPTTEIEVPDEYARRGGRAGGGGRVVKIPGGDVRTSFTRKPGAVLPDGFEEEQGDIDRQSDMAYLGGVNAQLDAGQVQRAMFQEREKELQRRDEEIDQERVRRAHIDTEIKRREGLISQREAEAEQIGRQPATVAAFWEERGPMAQLMGMIGVALGAGAQGLGAPENPALRMQEKMIDTWVKDRREQYERGRDRVDDAKGAYADALKQWGTPEAAEQDLRMRAHAAADSWFELMAGRAAQQSGDAKMMAGVQAEMANRRQLRLDRKLELQKLQTGEVIEQWQYRPDQFLQVGGGPKITPKQRALAVKLPDGSFRFARDETQARAVQKKVTTGVYMDQQLGRLAALAGDAGSKLDINQRRAQMQAIATELSSAYKDVNELGAYDNGVQSLIDRGIGDPTALISPGAVAKLRENQTLVRSKMGNSVRFDTDEAPDTLSEGGVRPQTARSDE